MRRIGLLLAAVALMTAMVLISALSSVAQEDAPSEPPPFEDTTDTPSFDDTTDEPPAEDTADDSPSEPPPFEDTTDEPTVDDGSGQTAPLCAPWWLQEWYPDWASGYWYFWWFQYCYTDEDGWYRSYDGWDWGPPIE